MAGQEESWSPGRTAWDAHHGAEDVISEAVEAGEDEEAQPVTRGESRSRSRSPSRGDVAGPARLERLERAVEAANARADRAVAAAMQAQGTATHALRVSFSSPRRIAEQVANAGLPDASRVELVQEAADLVGAAISADVAAHVAHHFYRHPQVAALSAANVRPLTAAFTRVEAEQFMQLAIDQAVERQARVWRIEVTQRGQVLASVTPTNAQVAEVGELRTAVSLLRSQVGALQARLDLASAARPSRPR
jgi:hypothetical protein